MSQWEDTEPDDDTTDDCPHCGASIYDDAERCPACGEYLSREDAPPRGKPWYVVVGAIVSLAIVAWWLLG